MGFISGAVCMRYFVSSSAGAVAPVEGGGSRHGNTAHTHLELYCCKSRHHALITTSILCWFVWLLINLKMKPARCGNRRLGLLELTGNFCCRPTWIRFTQQLTWRQRRYLDNVSLLPGTINTQRRWHASNNINSFF